MCGISGIVSDEPAEVRWEAVRRMCHSLVHRGPDSHGMRELGFATIGMRRLRIIDLSPEGDQPMSNEDGTIWVVFNGEIYNFQSLRPQLEAAGHILKSQTDTEIIVHLYEEMGPRLVERLRGMFAFAVVDSGRREVFLARDRLGIKPLYYTDGAGPFSFASEVKALLTAGRTTSDLDLEALDRYLSFGCVPAPSTMLRGVRALPPGHAVLLSNGSHREYRYWDLPPEGSVSCPPPEVVPRVRSLLEESIRLHSLSDVPLGAFLSGGIDSSAVVGLMARVLGRPPVTFNVTFRGAPARFDESEHARFVARTFDAQHTDVVIDGSAVRDEMDRIVWHLDQPSADGVNSYFVSKAAREGGLIVSLSGLGGDELFGGYGTYQVVPRWAGAASAWGRVPESVRRRIGRGLERVARLRDTGGRWHKLGRLAEAGSAVSLYAVARLLLAPEERAGLLSPEVRAELNGGGDPVRLLASYARRNESPWRTVTRLEMRNYMAHRLLRDTDVMSMAHSLEVRVPLIDHELVEFVAGLGRPTLRGPKPLLVAALRDIVPRSIVERPKHGFEFPMDHWMRQELRPLVEDALSEESVKARGLFDPMAVHTLHQRFRDRRQEYQAVWQLVVLELWMRAYLDKKHA